MIKRSFESIAETWLAGLLVLLPLALTAAVLAWVVGLVNRFVGPGSVVGRIFAALGYLFSSNPWSRVRVRHPRLDRGRLSAGVGRAIGTEASPGRLTDRTLRRIPLVGSLYNIADRFVGLLDRKEEADIGAMSPVWCFFGGDGVAVLALAPNAQPVEIEGRLYLAVLIPTAPVPFGGALLYVPVSWVRPANIGVETLTATYVSMGITPPAPTK